jgi:hypothetical protein
MNYFDPNKFDHYPDEPSEDEYWRLARDYGKEYGNGNCYDGTPPKLSKADKEKLRQYWEPKRDYDDLDVKLGLVDASELDPLVSFIDQRPPIMNVTAIEYRWRWQPTTNAASQNGRRDFIRLGSLQTQTQTHLLWGFATWQEMNAHLHISDKEFARHCFEQITAQYSLQSRHTGEYKFCYWIAKDEQQLTIPGFWSITVDCINATTPGRDVAYYANGKFDYKNNLTVNKLLSNTIGVK